MSVTQRSVGIAAAGTGVFAFLGYLWTLAPSVTFIDAGELSAVAHTFGIAHPTGYPLFTILGGLWAQLPIGSGIYRMNVFSAVHNAMAVGVFVMLIWFLLGLEDRKGVHPTRKGKQRDGQGVKRPRHLPDTLRLTVAVAGALLIGFSETFWSTALSIEVYSLHLLMLSLVLWTFAKSEFDISLDEQRRRRRWLLFAFLLGLSFTNHMTIILLAPALLVIFFRNHGFKADAWKRIGIAVPAFIAGLLPYLYLPLRAAALPSLNWGNPQTWERFLWHISGKQYRVWIFSSAEAAKKQLEYFFKTFPSEFAYVGVVLVVLGMFFAFMRHRRLGLMLVLLFIGCVLYSINYDIHDIDSYFLLAYVTAGVWAAFGLYAILTLIRNVKMAHALSIGAVVIGVFFGANFGRVSERGNYLVEDYTRNMFHSLKADALILSYQWDYWVSAGLYYQMVEGLRPDVIVIDKELLRRSWYLEQIQHNHPSLYRMSEQEIDAFKEELYKFEHDLPYVPEVIEARFNDMINSFVEKNYPARPVYFTIEMEKHLAPGFERIPEGLALRLYRPENIPSADVPVWDAFIYRPFSRGGRLIDALTQMYVNALANRGVLLYQSARHDAAARYFDRALQFDPSNTGVLQWKARNAAIKRAG